MLKRFLPAFLLLLTPCLSLPLKAQEKYKPFPGGNPWGLSVNLGKIQTIYNSNFAGLLSQFSLLKTLRQGSMQLRLTPIGNIAIDNNDNSADFKRLNYSISLRAGLEILVDYYSIKNKTLFITCTPTLTPAYQYSHTQFDSASNYSIDEWVDKKFESSFHIYLSVRFPLSVRTHLTATVGYGIRPWKDSSAEHYNYTGNNGNVVDYWNTVTDQGVSISSVTPSVGINYYFIRKQTY